MGSVERARVRPCRVRLHPCSSQPPRGLETLQGGRAPCAGGTEATTPHLSCVCTAWWPHGVLRHLLQPLPAHHCGTQLKMTRGPLVQRLLRSLGRGQQSRDLEASPGRLQSPRRKCCPFFFSFFLFFSFIKRKPLLKITRQISIMNCSCLYVDNYKDKIRPEVSAFSLPLVGVLRGCVSPQSWISGVTVLVEVAAPGPPSAPPPELPPELAASIQRGPECSWGLSPSPWSGVHCPGLVASP